MQKLVNLTLLEWTIRLDSTHFELKIQKIINNERTVNLRFQSEGPILNE